MEKNFACQYYHWGSKKTLDINNRQDKSPKALRSIEKRQDKEKTGNFWFKLDTKPNQKVSVLKRLDKRRSDEVAAIHLELLFRNNKRNGWGG